MESHEETVERILGPKDSYEKRIEKILGLDSIRREKLIALAKQNHAPEGVYKIFSPDPNVNLHHMKWYPKTKQDYEILEKAILLHAPEEFYMFALNMHPENWLKGRNLSLLEFGIENNADALFYSYGHMWKDKKMLKWAVKNKAYAYSYECYQKNISKDAIKFCAVHKQPPILYSHLHYFKKMPENFEEILDAAREFKITTDKELQNFRYLLKLSVLYGKNVIPYTKAHKEFDKLPLLDKEYAEIVKNHLTKRNTSSILNLVKMLQEMGKKPKKIYITQENKVKNLENRVIKAYGKKVSINNPIRAIRTYLLVENNKTKNILEKIIARDYKPKEIFFFSKSYMLDTEEDKNEQDLSNLETLLITCASNINKIKPDFKLDLTENKDIEQIKKVGITVEKEIKEIYNQYNGKKIKLDKTQEEALLDAKGQINRVMSYTPKSKSGSIKIRLNSANKISQAELLESISSCFHLTNGSNRHYSQSYLTTDRINFVGIYDKENEPVARFTFVINPKERKLGIASKVYKKTNNNFVPYVQDWLKSYAEHTGYKLGGEITLPVKEFYDDAGSSYTGKIKLIDNLNEITEY